VDQHRADEHFRQTVFEYTNYAYSLSYRILGNAEDAQDAVQEAFLKLYRNFAKFDTQKSMKNWICTITINTCRDFFRSRRRYKDADNIDDNPVSDQGASSAGVENKIFTQELMQPLDIKYRAVITLFYLEQRSVEEIAVILKRPKTLIKVWLHRARNTMLKNIARMERAPIAS
jgi:RNA polymerase sigma-70 factor (ECF subfamily)